MNKTAAQEKAQFLADLHLRMYAVVFESGRFDAEPWNSTIPASAIYGLVTPKGEKP